MRSQPARRIGRNGANPTCPRQHAQEQPMRRDGHPPRPPIPRIRRGMGRV